MVNIQIDIDEGQNKIVGMCKLVNSLESKQSAISKIITDWAKVQSISNEEIEKKVIENWKEENSNATSGDWIKRHEKHLKECYKGYGDGLKVIIKNLSKKFKKKEDEVNEILDGEQYEEGEDKFKDKVWEDWGNQIHNLQDNLEKKHSCKIEHEEGFFETESNILELKMRYCGGKEVEYRLGYFAKQTVIKVIDILRGSKSLRDVMDDNNKYLKYIENQVA